MEPRIKTYCAIEGARVFAAMIHAIEEHTLVDQETVELLARDVADAHTGIVASMLRGPSPVESSVLRPLP